MGAKNLKAIRENGADAGQTTIKPNAGLAEPGEDLDELFEKFPGTKSISVKRFTTDRKWESLGSIPTDLLDDDYMINEFGPGLYTLYLRDVDGKMISGAHTIRIGDRASRKPATSAASVAPAPDPPAHSNGNGNGYSAQIELLKAELERRDQMLLRMIDAISTRQAPAAAAPSLPDLVSSLANLQKLQAAAPAPVSFSEKLMERAFTMATRAPAAGEGGERSEMFSFLRDVWTEMKPALMPAPGGQVAPASSAAPAALAVAGVSETAATTTAAPAAEEETVTVDIEPWIENLKDQCRAGRPVEMIAPFIETECNRSEEVGAIVEQLLTGDFEDFLKLDSELQMPGFKVWFSKLFEVLRVRILGSAGDSGGAGRDGTNP